MNQFDPFGQDLGLLSSLEEEVVTELEELSRRLLNGLFVLIRSSWLYDLGNDTLKIAQVSFGQILADFEARGQEVVELRLRNESFFINGQMVKLDFSSYKSAKKLEKLFGIFELDEIIFPLPLSGEEIGRLSRVLNQVANSNKRFADLAQECRPIIASQAVDEVIDGSQEFRDPRLEILELYSHGLTTLKFFVDDLKRGVRPKYAKIKRLCLKLMQLESKYQNLLLALVHIHSVKGQLYSHMLNTAILCLTFARRIGLPSSATLDLGMTAFYQNLPWALVNKVYQDAENLGLETIHEIDNYRSEHQDSMLTIRNHVAHLLLMIGGFNNKIINRLIVAYETQIVDETDFGGLYVADIDVNVLTEIVGMASAYDRLTSLPADGRELRTDEIIKSIVADGERFDPFVAQLFGSSFGTYPIGSLVELNNGEVAVVFDLPESFRHSNRPRVKIVADRNGTLNADGDVVDLAERGDRGEYLRSIEHVYSSSDFGLSISSFFFGPAVKSMSES